MHQNIRIIFFFSLFQFCNLYSVLLYFSEYIYIENYKIVKRENF